MSLMEDCRAEIVKDCDHLTVHQISKTNVEMCVKAILHVALKFQVDRARSMDRLQ